jgi:hypothetical protein
MGSTYGTWLYGDRRGWRMRGHREHVEGDYKNPPPEGVGVAARCRSIRGMRRAPVHLTWEQRVVVCGAMVEALRYYRVEVVDWTVTATHFHGLARFPSLSVADNAQALRAWGLVKANSLQDGRDPIPRFLLGKAKAWALHQIKMQNLWTGPAGIWGVRSMLEPVRDRPHQLAVVRYIRGHAQEGGAVWSGVGERGSKAPRPGGPGR